MKPEHRLRATSDFSRVYRTGSRVRMPSVVAVATLADPAPAKVGFTSSRSVGGAVARNRAKRRLRAATAPIARTLRPGTLLVLQATPATGSIAWQKLESDVRTATARVGALDA